MRFGAALDLWHKGDLHEAEQARGHEPPPVDVDALLEQTESAPPTKSILEDLWRQSAGIVDAKRRAEVRTVIKARADDLDQPQQQALGV